MPCAKIVQQSGSSDGRGYVVKHMGNLRIWFTLLSDGALRLDKTTCTKEAQGILAMFQTCDKSENGFLTEAQSRLASMPNWTIRRAV